MHLNGHQYVKLSPAGVQSPVIMPVVDIPLQAEQAVEIRKARRRRR